MRMNLGRTMSSLSINSQEFLVIRSQGSFVGGRWTEGTPLQITMRGIVTVMSERELAQIPEGDQIKGAMKFCSKDPIYATHKDGTTTSGISDQIVWQGERYKIFQVAPWVDYGFYQAAGERIKGA
jgi:hypothetical protein